MLARAPFHADLADGPQGGHAVWLTARDGVRRRAAGGGGYSQLTLPAQ